MVRTFAIEKFVEHKLPLREVDAALPGSQHISLAVFDDAVFYRKTSGIATVLHQRRENLASFKANPGNSIVDCL